MDSSDEDFLPDPEKPRMRKKEPPDRDEEFPTTSQPRGLKRKHEEDSIKGKCFFIFFGDS